MTQRLKTFYLNSVIPQLQSNGNYKNFYEIPKVKKVVINRGIGDASQNSKNLENSINELSKITGQKGVVTKAKKAIATFKLRQGMPVGVTVTLRGEKMYAFLDRLINLALPRIRDFQGVKSSSFDGNGNYSIGLDEQLMFPEIKYDDVDQVRGMDISIVTTAKDDQEALALLKQLGMPFQ